MIRVTYVLGSFESRYTQHHRHSDISVVQKLVDENMKRSYFNIEVTNGYIRIYPSKVSAIEIRDVSHEEAILKAQQKGI